MKSDRFLCHRLLLGFLDVTWHNVLKQFNPRPTENFCIKYLGQENKGNDHQLKKLLIVKQILLVSTLGNVQSTVWRICILNLGCKGLTYSATIQERKKETERAWSWSSGGFSKSLLHTMVFSPFHLIFVSFLALIFHLQLSMTFLINYFPYFLDVFGSVQERSKNSHHLSYKQHVV